LSATQAVVVADAKAAKPPAIMKVKGRMMARVIACDIRIQQAFSARKMKG